MEVKISYCHLDLPEEVCRFDTPAVVMRGNGPFLFEIAEDFQCKCNRRLYANRSWRLGDYIYTEYNCGKVRSSYGVFKSTPNRGAVFVILSVQLSVCPFVRPFGHKRFVSLYRRNCLKFCMGLISKRSDVH